MAIPQEAQELLFQVELANQRKPHDAAQVIRLIKGAIEKGYVPGSEEGLAEKSYRTTIICADISYALANAAYRGKLADRVRRLDAEELVVGTVDKTPGGMEIKIAEEAFDESGPKPRQLEWGNPDKNYWLAIVAEWEASQPRE